MEKQDKKQTKKIGGWKLSAETRKRIGDARRGTHLSEETKKKISLKNKLAFKEGRKNMRGENNPFFGKKLTLEHKAKIKETRERIKATWSPEKRERVERMKEVMNSPHPVCQKCGIVIRRHNKTGMCRGHKNLSIYVKECAKRNYQENIDERRKKGNAYMARPEIKAKKQTYDMEYRKRNAKKIDARVYEWRKDKKNREPLFRFKEQLKCRMYSAFKALGEKKPARSMEMLGGTLEEIRTHIETRFTNGMTWENYGKWHADHVIPLSSAKTEKEMVKLCHYMNLQPLWAIDNLRKGKKINNRP